MSNPVDIKIAHINKNENTGKSIDKDQVHEVFQTNIEKVMRNWISDTSFQAIANIPD